MYNEGTHVVREAYTQEDYHEDSLHFVFHGFKDLKRSHKLLKESPFLCCYVANEVYSDASQKNK